MNLMHGEFCTALILKELKVSDGDTRHIVDSSNPAGRIVDDAYNRKRRSVIANTKVLVFGPGPGNENPGFLEREAIKDTLKQAGCRADYPESILIGGNAVFGESILIGDYNLVFILLMGLGS